MSSEVDGLRSARPAQRHGFPFPALLAAAVLIGLSTPGGWAASSRTSHHRGVPDRLPEHPAVGEKAPDFSLADLRGREVALGEFLGRGYLVLLFGSATSHTFRREALEMKARWAAWSRWEVQALVVYTREAHPGRLRADAPRDYAERVALARKTREELQIDFPLLVDGWEDRVHEAYGAIPHAAYLVDSEGTIMMRQARAKASELDRKLRQLLRVDPR